MVLEQLEPRIAALEHKISQVTTKEDLATLFTQLQQLIPVNPPQPPPRPVAVPHSYPSVPPVSVQPPVSPQTYNPPSDGMNNLIMHKTYSSL